jgi:hypothetical protein
VSTPARLELVNLFIRAAREAERQNPMRSRVAPLLRHLAKLAEAPGLTGDDWDGIAEAAFRCEERLVVKVPEQRPRPLVVTRRPRTPWSA